MKQCNEAALIVTLMGPVGVGKSTNIRLLTGYFKLRGTRVVSTFIKSSHGLASLLATSLTALGAGEPILYPGGFYYVKVRANIFRRVFRLWRLLDEISIATKFFFKVYLPCRFGATVLVEEGVYMSLFSYCKSWPRFFGTQPVVSPLLASLMGYVSRMNHINFVLGADDQVLTQRRLSRNYRRSELTEYVSMQKDWMRRLDLSDTVFVDTTNASVLKVHKEILAALGKRKCAKL